MPSEHQFNDRLIRFPELERIFGVCKRTVRRKSGKRRVASVAADWPGGGDARKPGQSVFSKVESTKLIERRNMIAYIYRPKRQRNGKQVFNRIWRARLKLNGDAKARDISLNCADKQTAEQKLRDIIRDYERTAVGLMAPAAQRETFENPMERLVDGYVADLKALGRSTDHVRHVDTRLRRLMRECKWQNLREATADSFLRWRTEQKKSPKTINEYQAACRPCSPGCANKTVSRPIRLKSSARWIRAARKVSIAGH